MTSSRMDYFAFTIKPEHWQPNEPDSYGKTPLEHCLSTLKVTLLLGDLMDKMTLIGRVRNYEQLIKYENISIKIPPAHTYATQGIHFEATSQGLDYFYEYLHGFGLDFKQWAGMLRALCFCGYAVNISRLDFAMDDICINGAATKISIRRVLSAIEDGELCCKARVYSDTGDDFRRLFSFKTRHKRVKGEDITGVTLQLGSRESETICRFYDKYAEQKQKGKELPEGCTAWTRCEFEYKGSNAMSVLNAYIDNDDQAFSEYMCGSALNYVRFIDRTSENVSRCPCKRWWKEFLNGATKCIRFEHLKPARSAAEKFKRWYRSAVLPSLYTFISEHGFEAYEEWLEDMTSEALSDGRDLIKNDLVQNYRDYNRNHTYEQLDGFKRWDYNSPLPAENLQENIKRDHWDYYQQFYKVVRLGQKPQYSEGYDHVL